MFHMVTNPQILDNIKRFSALNVCENPKRLEYKSCLFIFLFILLTEYFNHEPCRYLQSTQSEESC